MIVVLRPDYSRANLEHIMARLAELGYEATPVVGAEKTIVLGLGGAEHAKVDAIEQLKAESFVEDAFVITKPYKLVARETKSESTIIDVRGATIGGPEIAMIAGPCTVESEAQLMLTAEAVARAGAKFLRGGAYKPSTSPYGYQGMGEPGLKLLQQAGKQFNLRVVTEVMDVRKVELVAQYADVLQIGTRNMQNYDLLREVGQSKTPILLKRGMNARIEEWLLAAEYIAQAGNERIMMCERGIRTFETATRNTLDLSAVPLVKQLSHLPVIVDPSHGVGKRDLVGPMARAAVAAGADGLIIEVHPAPDHALKDGSQSMTFEGFAKLMPQLARIAEAVDRSVDIAAIAQR